MRIIWRSSREPPASGTELVFWSRKLFWKLVAAALLVAVAAFFVKTKKESLVREGANFLQTLLSHETALDVKIGKISGKLNGRIRFDDVRLEDPDLPVGLRVLFRAERVEFRYHLIDFLTKKFNSKITVNVEDPELYWLPKIRLRSDPFPFFGWLRDIILTQRQRLAVHVKDLKLITGLDRQEFPGIRLDYENDRFEVLVPVSHYEFLGNDINTQIIARARLEWGLLKSEDRLVGEIFTEGTVVNWKPIPSESHMDFTLTRTDLNIDASDILGGIEFTGQARFAGDLSLGMDLKAKDYPLQNFEPFFGRGDVSSYDGTLDLEAHFHGPLDALNTQAHVAIQGGKAGKSHYKVMNIHVSGVYPTLKVYDSQLLTQDGIAMKFADQTIEFRDLFSSRTYHHLISDSDQSTVAMGDWEFKRPVDENQLPEFLVERTLGKYARLQFRKYNEPEGANIEADTQDKQQVEVGFEYRLRSKDSLQYKVREDEQFVGIERKLSF